MKKNILFIGISLSLCGCSIINDTVEDMKSTKYGLAKNSINSYANSIQTAYTDYEYSNALGNYSPSENGIPVIIDGKEVKLNIKYYGDDITCKTIMINNGSVELDECKIYGYQFDYKNGEAIKK